MGCYFLLQGVFLTEGLNPHLLHWEVVLFVRLFCFYHWVTHEVTIVSHVGHIMGYIFIYLYTSLSWHNSLSFFYFSVYFLCMQPTSLRSCLTLCDLTDCSLVSPLSMGFPRQEYKSDLPFLPPRDLPDPRIDPASLISSTLRGRFFTSSTIWEG